VSNAGTRSKKGRTPKRPRAVGPEGSPAKRAAELLDRLLPEDDEQSGTSFSDRQLRRTIAHKMDQAYSRTVETFETIEEAVKAERAENDRQMWEDVTKRRESDEHVRLREENREDIRLVVEVEERRTEMRDKSRARNLLMVLTAICVCAAVTLAFMTVHGGKPWYLGSSAFSGLLSAGGLFYLLRSMQWVQGRGAPGGDDEDATVPFEWSGLEPELSAEEGT
jgi:hypothetical protein